MKKKKTLKKYIYERDNQRCHFCNKELKFKQISLDHYLPKSENGVDDIFNIVLSCKKCNKEKKNRIPEDYESILIKHFKQGVKDKKITASALKIKYDELLTMVSFVYRIEYIGKSIVLQGGKYRFYVKNNHIYQIVKFGQPGE